MVSGLTAGTAEPPLRGALRLTDRMEMLQDGYLQAVAAAAGCTMAKPSPDDGIDWILTHRSDGHMVDCEVDLKVQMKSTYQCGPDPANGHVTVKVERKRFLMLSQSPVMQPRILVAMIMPRRVENWVVASHQNLTLHHCAYWINLEGAKDTGAAELSVRVPTSNRFDDISLCQIMERLGKGGRP